MTAIGCGLLVLIAAALFGRELRLWRRREEMESIVFRYSRRRLIRRSIGCALLASVGVMTYLGLEVLDFRGNPTGIQVYFALIGAQCLVLLAIPILDFRETYRQIVRDGAERRLRREVGGGEEARR